MTKIISFSFELGGRKYYTLDDEQILTEYDLPVPYDPTRKYILKTWDLTVSND